MLGRGLVCCKIQFPCLLHPRLRSVYVGCMGDGAYVAEPSVVRHPSWLPVVDASYLIHLHRGLTLSRGTDFTLSASIHSQSARVTSHDEQIMSGDRSQRASRKHVGQGAAGAR